MDQVTNRKEKNKQISKQTEKGPEIQQKTKKYSFEVTSESTRSRGTQTENVPSSHVPTQILSLFNNESEMSSNFFTKPHSIFTLLLFLGAVYYYSQYETVLPGPDSYLKNCGLGILFLYLSIVVFAILFFPISYTQRPHPVFWKIVVGFGLSWFAAVIFANFLSRDDLFRFLREMLDPKLGQYTVEKSYAEDCRIYIPEHSVNPWSNVLDQIDVFISAHFVGWFFKMIILRDFKLCQIQSVMFEILEITFRHWLPNFWECWWDHIFLDLIICNTGGMIAGYYFLKYFQVKPFKWSLKTTKKNTWFQNVKQLVMVPQLETHEWKVFSCSWNFVAVCWYIILFNLTDLSYFFNKFVLWIEPSHKICAIRTFIIGFLCIPASREYYEFTINKDINKMGSAVWMVHAIIGAQILLFVQNYQGEFTDPFPWYVIVFWTLVGAFFIITLSILVVQDMIKFLNKRKLKELRNQKQKQLGIPVNSTSSSSGDESE